MLKCCLSERTNAPDNVLVLIGGHYILVCHMCHCHLHKQNVNALYGNSRKFGRESNLADMHGAPLLNHENIIILT